ncbi:MAG: hypothetical protein HYW62_02110 [Candidatus Levybacteria bacterium]|nr:hypothetical protein [Candidatus Levybacteria bacterium]
MAKFLSIAVVVLFAVIAGFSLLHKGLPPTHDGEYHVVRFFLFDEALRDGNLYPRWSAHLNSGFGVPLFNFVYPLPNYLASFLHLFSFSFIDSFKIIMFAATIIGAIFFYLWTKEFWGRLGGIVSSVFYTFSPYHFADIYIRGSIGEVLALAFFPAFLWSYTKFALSKQRLFFILSSLFLALIIFSHNILALMFFFFSLSYITLLIYKEKNKKYLMLNTFYLILLGLGLSAIFWLPAIFETKFAAGLQIFDIGAHFPDLYQLLIPSWGSGFSGAGLQNALSFQIGLANLFVIFLSLVVAVWQVIKRDKKSIYTIFFLIWFILTFYLMLSISLPIWNTVPLMNYFQFPWRLLSLEILFASFLAGSIFSLKIKNKSVKIALAIFLVFAVFTLGVGYARPAYYLLRDDNYYTSRSNFIDGTNSPGNVFNTIFLKNIPSKEKERIVILKGDAKISSRETKSNLYNFSVNSKNNSEILMNVAYYPGWNVYVNNVKTNVEVKNGRFSFLVPAGEGQVRVVFEETPIRIVADLISVLSLIALSALFIQYKSSKI